MVSSNGRRGGLSQRVATAPVAAAALIAGFAVAVATGSRSLGGVVLAAGGLICIAVWRRRDGPRTTIWLTLAGLIAFAASHLLGLVIGAWPAVLVVSAAVAGLYWRVSDSRRPPRRATPEASAGSPRTALRSDRPGSRA